MPASRPIGTPRTTRLRKLECACGNIAYQSRARLSAGLLTCCCGRVDASHEAQRHAYHALARMVDA